jgi:hypothetical protein
MNPERSIVPRRVAGVSVALAGTGAFLGAGLAAGMAALGGFALRAAGVVFPGGSIVTSAALGAALGAVLTPMTALSLLRRVALGKALLFTVLGMSVGVAGGHLMSGQTVISAASGAGAFFLVALTLRVRAALSRRGAPAERQDFDSEHP